MSLTLRSIMVLCTGTVLGLGLSLGAGVLADREPEHEELPWEEARLLAEVLERVRQEYVEPVDDRTLMESAVRGMVQELDPHSQFLDVDQYEEIRISTTGNYSGVGLEVNMAGDLVTVVAPLEGGPAQRAGLRTGDVIVSIDGVAVDEKNIADTIARMRGKSGTRVSISVEREGEPESLSFEIIRDQVQVRSVRWEMLEPGYGYLRISHFSETTYKDLRKAARSMERQSPDGLRGVILDLRSNPGGVLEAAVDVADAFLEEGVIVTASGRGRESNFQHEARSGDLTAGAAMVVMVDEGSASASEIVAGALQDHDRAVVVGHRTFGKGSVQTVMPLSDGRAIKLTTSRYYTPAGLSIHGKGITPDVMLTDSEEHLAANPAKTHITDEATALLAGDGELSQALDLLKDEPVLQSRAD